MNRKDLEAVANGIFDIVKHDVIMNIENWMNEIIEDGHEDDEVYFNVVENLDLILDYYNDDYLMSLLLDHLEEVIVEEEDLLIFGFYHCSSIRSAIDYILSERPTFAQWVYMRYNYYG